MNKTLVTKRFDMEGYESKSLKRESTHIYLEGLKSLQVQHHPKVSDGKLIKDKIIIQFNYKGSMNQGGMKRGVDSIKNWPSTAVQYLMKNGYDFDKHGNCYLKGNKIIDKSELRGVERKFIQTLINLPKYVG
jgi:hypothetical protein